jgi:hypothetical protein
MIQNYQSVEKNKNECDEPSKVCDEVLHYCDCVENLRTSLKFKTPSSPVTILKLE